MSTTSSKWRPRDWGLVLGLLVASGVALCGVWLKIALSTLLFRSGSSGLLIGMTVAVTVGISQRAQHRLTDD
ncbi:MAG: hypothetical protein ACK5Q5_16320 [Planctomycetaceae bacterium]